MDIPPSALIPSAPLSIPFTYWSKEQRILLLIAREFHSFLDVLDLDMSYIQKHENVYKVHNYVFCFTEC